MGNVFVYVIHDLARLDIEPGAAGVRVIVSGHSHKPQVRERDGVLHVNPGSCGPRRFKLPISVGELIVSGSGVEARTLDSKAALRFPGRLHRRRREPARRDGPVSGRRVPPPSRDGDRRPRVQGAGDKNTGIRAHGLNLFEGYPHSLSCRAAGRATARLVRLAGGYARSN